jgi:hypothetical protein
MFGKLTDEEIEVFLNAADMLLEILSRLMKLPHI